MDRVRLGRALGRGARGVARTAYEAVEAASAPSPAASTPQRATSVQPTASATRPQTITVPSASPSAPLRTYAVPAMRAAAGMAGPLKTASRALWHEVMGSFFALFAASFALAVWHSRSGATSAVPNERYRFYWFCALALLFAYFSASSFLRAKKKA